MWTLNRPDHLTHLRVPPAWTNVVYNMDPKAECVCMGTDAAGRRQRLYSVEHIANAKSDKFERVRALLSEWKDIRTQIESDINDESIVGKDREAAIVAYLIYETGIRPGSTTDTLAKVQAFGATTLQLRHVKLCPRGVRLQFIGKKGVPQNVLVTNPFLVEELTNRKSATTAWSQCLFNLSASKLNDYIATLGSGNYSAKDFRTGVGTSLALKLLGSRQRFPKSASKRKRVINDALDQVSKKLGNTRTVARNSYVDPLILERIILVAKE